jgi:hypothetical protein
MTVPGIYCSVEVSYFSWIIRVWYCDCIIIWYFIIHSGDENVTLYEGQEVGRRKGTYVNNVNALGNANQHVNKLNDFNILYGNADSLRNKLDELNSRLQDSDRSKLTS